MHIYLPRVGVVAAELRAGDVHCSETIRAEKGASPATVRAVLCEVAVHHVTSDGVHVAA